MIGALVAVVGFVDLVVTANFSGPAEGLRKLKLLRPLKFLRVVEPIQSSRIGRSYWILPPQRPRHPLDLLE